MKFFEELKRRKVLKTIGVYGAAAIVISQLVATIFPYLFLPNWTVTFVIVLVILGFPITFFLSWTYDLQPETKKENISEIENVATDKKWSLTKKILLKAFPGNEHLIPGNKHFILENGACDSGN